MAEDGESFVSWEEHIVSSERGNRLVHFYLRSTSGDSLFAVVGMERSIRHMTYVVSQDFVQAFGSNFASAKWRARRDVVEWLDLIVSNSQTMGIPEGIIVSGLCARRSCPPDQLVQRKLKAHSSGVKWSGSPWICAKQLKHYPAFCSDATTIAVHSFVFIAAEQKNHYLGYVEDLYEDKKGQKRVKVRWFHRSQEFRGIIPMLDPHPREVFMTPNVQVIGAECVAGLATVLTPKHYERSLELVSDVSESGIFMCSRQLEKCNLKPFALTKLRGYTNQILISSLDDPEISRPAIKRIKTDEKDDEGHTLGDPPREHAKRLRGCDSKERLKTCSSTQSQVTYSEQSYPKLRLKISGKTTDVKPMAPESNSPVSYKVDGLVEFLCLDSGIRGCWFRCKILKVSKKHLKLRLQYRDLLDADDAALLEEWVPAYTMANPDKLRMRYPDRMTIRPEPPKDSEDLIFDVGAPVDAWWYDGWWEGVVIQADVAGKGTYEVYLPDENRFATFQRKDVRISREWFNDKWVDIKAKTDILSYLSVEEHLKKKKPVQSSNKATISRRTATVDNKFVTSCETKTREKVDGIPVSAQSLIKSGKNTTACTTHTDAGGCRKGKKERKSNDIKAASQRSSESANEICEAFKSMDLKSKSLG